MLLEGVGRPGDGVDGEGTLHPREDLGIWNSGLDSAFAVASVALPFPCKGHPF